MLKMNTAVKLFSWSVLCDLWHVGEICSSDLQEFLNALHRRLSALSPIVALRLWTFASVLCLVVLQELSGLEDQLLLIVSSN